MGFWISDFKQDFSSDFRSASKISGCCGPLVSTPLIHYFLYKSSDFCNQLVAIFSNLWQPIAIVLMIEDVLSTEVLICLYGIRMEYKYTNKYMLLYFFVQATTCLQAYNIISVLFYVCYVLHIASFVKSLWALPPLCTVDTATCMGIATALFCGLCCTAGTIPHAWVLPPVCYALWVLSTCNGTATSYCMFLISWCCYIIVCCVFIATEHLQLAASNTSALYIISSIIKYNSI